MRITLDIRPMRDIIRLGRIPGAVQINSEKLVESIRDKTLVQKKYAIVCTTGTRAARAAFIAQQNGYDATVYDVFAVYEKKLMGDK